jgi:hypothetical protein
MSKHINGPDFFNDRQLGSDELIDFQSRVLDALEANEHPQAEAAYDDSATKDNATSSQRKAWLAIYGPMTDVLTD